jgi:outer membrane cobalamin receptor
MGVGADPWPEAKLVARWRPGFGGLELTGTVARKGRVPSLRERFDLVLGGNPKLAPEESYLYELRTIEQVNERVRFEVAPFFRHTTGLIILDPTTMLLQNLSDVDFYGIDMLGRVRVHPMVEVGGAYDYIEATSAKTGPDPLPRLPHNRAEVWVQGTPDPRLSVLARVHYFGSTIDQQTTLPANTLLDVTATSPLSKKYLAVLRVDDLLDERPLTRAGYHTEGRVISLVLQGQWE